MGTLRKYELKTTRCKVFFETGTGLGHSLKHALDNGDFSRLYSSEIHEKTAERATDKFKHHPNVSIINSDSLSALHQVVPTIPKEEPILFFLDAHFPGEVEAGFDYQQNFPSDQTLPL